MTAKELMKRNNKAENLRVLQTEDGSYFVESEKGKILYQVTLTDDEASCTCGDFAKNSRKDSNFRCKHILSVMNSVHLGEIENGCFLEKKRPKLDERWIIEIEGSQFVKYAGLLDYAHQIGISSVDVEPLQLPPKDNGNFAIVKATVVSRVGESFTDIGDANPTNCNAKVGKHLLRLASTRAIARALRSFTNVGLTALEELADLNDVIGSGDQKPRTAAKKKATPKTRASPSAKKSGPVKSGKSDNSDNLKFKGNGAGETEAKASVKSPDAIHPKMSEAQKRAIYNLSRRRGISVEELEQRAFETYGIELENMYSKDASSFIREATLFGTLYKRELTIQALKECDWREEDLSILDGRRYQYIGIKKGVAIEGNFASYEYILEGLFRLQIGFDKGRIETGILMLTSERSEKSRLGTNIELAKLEVEQLYPTISMPVNIALFDLGTPELPDENAVKGGESDGISVPAVKTIEEYTEEDWENFEPFP